MKIKYLCIALLLAGNIKAQHQKNVKISGIVTGDLKGHNYIRYFKGAGHLDSIKIEKERFYVELPFTETTLIYMVSEYEIAENGNSPFISFVITGPDDILISYNVSKGFGESSVTGPNPNVTLSSALLKGLNEKAPAMAEKETVRIHGTSKFSSLHDPVKLTKDSLRRYYCGLQLREFVKANSSNKLCLYLLSELSKQYTTIDQVDSAWQYVSDKLKQSSEGSKLKEYIYYYGRKSKNYHLGDVIEDFQLNGPQHEKVSLYSFRGKYVWIDFWASWCIPCKKLLPRMQQLYKYYRGERFEIVGFSIDKSPSEWRKALNVLNLPWPQALDDKNVFGDFMLKGVPTSILISPEGKLLLVDEGFHVRKGGDNTPIGEMEKKLEELFGPCEINNSKSKDAAQNTRP